MIYSDEFVWLHFPKCAGTKVEHLFEKYYSANKEVHQDPVGITKDPGIAWHDSIEEREQRNPNFKLGSRTIICPIRHLPGWLESRYNFEFQRSPDLHHQPELLLEGIFLESDGSASHAEHYVKRFIPDNLLNSNEVKFLRTEFFEIDFKEIFSQYIDTSIIPPSEFNEKVNVSKNHLSDSFRQKLNSPDKEIYSHCPHWNKVESLAYNK